MNSAIRAGTSGRGRVNVNDDFELRRWALQLNVTPEEIVSAVSAVGDSASELRAHLARQRVRVDRSGQGAPIA